ncbi:MAG: helix-turn-helix domain-containing protein [Defluviitaleaceae bacterium]|nr:helix-turn-helix domain-containing protein [Defluviitaleaceae bacterium]
MISGQILQSTINGLKNITKYEISVVDKDGKIIVSTESDIIGTTIDFIIDFIKSMAESMTSKGYNYFKVFDNGVVEYIVCIKGEESDAYRIGQLATFQIQNLLIAYKERYDKDSFIKNLLLDNLLLVDIYARAKKMNIETQLLRVVCVIEINTEENINILDQIKEYLPTRTKDFLTVVDQKSIIWIREIKENESKEELEDISKKFQDVLFSHTGKNFKISMGRKINDLKYVSLSFKEAKMALEVARIFYPEKTVINYEELGLGRLIYQLPDMLCKMFMDEVLGNITVEYFDDEILTTVNKFFENNLNVSETSRQLYIHRNTLVYRIDKLQKITGLDVRSFDDAIIFKMALMVSKYMDYKNENYYN